MKIEIEIEINENEFDLDWEDNAYIKVTQPSKSLFEIEANKEGLISLSKILLSLAYAKDSTTDFHIWAEKNTEKGYWYGDLDEGSLDLSVTKIERQGRKKNNEN